MSLEFGKNSSNRLRLDMLGCVHTEAREANPNEISHVRCNTFSHILSLGVQIAESSEPAIIELEGIIP